MLRIVTEREKKLLTKYCKEEIQSKTSFRYDENVIYKLVCLQKLFEPMMDEVYVLIHAMKKMYGVEGVRKFLGDLEYSPNLVADGSTNFGYNIGKEEFFFDFTVNENGPLEVATITTDFNRCYGFGSLDVLKIKYQYEGEEKGLNFVTNYAIYEVRFCNEFEKWYKRFCVKFDLWVNN